MAAITFALPAVIPGLGPWLIEATARSLDAVRILMPTSVHFGGSTFSISRTDIQIIEDCTPMFPTLLLSSGILAFPAAWKWKVAGVALGTSLLWAYNIVRIYLLMAVLRFWPAQFDLVHVYLWQTMTLLVVLGCFLFWVRLVEGARSNV